MGSFWRSLPGLWQEKTLILLGVALAASPWLGGYENMSAATGNSLVVGLVFVIGAAVAICSGTNYGQYTTAFVAYWLTLAARILGYDDAWTPTVLQIVFGVSGVVLSMSSAIVQARARNLAGGTVHPFEPPSQPTPHHPGRKAA